MAEAHEVQRGEVRLTTEPPAGPRSGKVDATFDLVHRTLDGLGRWARRLRIFVRTLVIGSGAVGFFWVVSFLAFSEGRTRIVGTMLSLLVFGACVAMLAFTAWSLGGVMLLPDAVAAALRTHTATAQELVHDVKATPRHRSAVRASVAALRATRDAKDVAALTKRVLPVASGITLIMSGVALVVVVWGALVLPLLLLALIPT